MDYRDVAEPTEVEFEHLKPWTSLLQKLSVGSVSNKPYVRSMMRA